MIFTQKSARRATTIASLIAATCWTLPASAQMPAAQPIHIGPVKAGATPATNNQVTPTQTASASRQTTATTFTSKRHPRRRHVWPTPAMSAVHAAYQRAITQPTRQNFVNGALIYDYEPNKLYTLHTSPRFLTAIALRPGEKLVSKAAGDTVRWVMDETEGVTNAVGQSQTIVIIKPIEGGLRTNVVLTTDQRVYLLEAVSHAEPYYTSMISWNYPADQAREAQLAKAVSTVKAMASSANVIAPAISVSHLDFDYSITSKGGGGFFHAASAAPPWTPLRVFDDGSKTYIQFPHNLATTEAPPLFLIGPHDSAELVNYRFSDGYYVVDRLISVAELRLGDKPQSIVRIAFDGTRSRTQ